MNDIENKKTGIDAFLLSVFSLLMLPLLIMGMPSIFLLAAFMIMAFSYFALRKREVKHAVYTLVVWPFLTVVLALFLQRLILATPSTISFFWLSWPGIILFLGTATAVLSATRLMKQCSTEQTVTEE